MVKKKCGRAPFTVKILHECWRFISAAQQVKFEHLSRIFFELRNVLCRRDILPKSLQCPQFFNWSNLHTIKNVHEGCNKTNVLCSIHFYRWFRVMIRSKIWSEDNRFLVFSNSAQKLFCENFSMYISLFIEAFVAKGCRILPLLQIVWQSMAFLPILTWLNVSEWYNPCPSLTVC